MTEEILNKNEQASFPIASEHQLCRQFGVSRVTVRLALSDLENRGLIYRKHGKGTFAYGQSTRIHRYLGILMKSPLSTEHRPIAEMIRGTQMAMAAIRSAILLINTPPEQWRPEKASSLGGVIVVPQDVTQSDIETLKNRSLPFLTFTESDLPGPRIMLGQKKAAKQMTEQLLRLGHRRFAILSGYDASLDDTKRKGIHEALREAGIDPAQVPEITAHGQEAEIHHAVGKVLGLQPRPTAVIALDDSLGAVMSLLARRDAHLNVPKDLSIVSFHDWPFLNFVEIPLTTVHFEFYNAGLRAAEALSHAALTGDPMIDICFEPTFRAGRTIGPAPTSA